MDERKGFASVVRDDEAVEAEPGGALAGRWRVMDTPEGLRLTRLRALGSENANWAQLLVGRLTGVDVFVLYFPSRFNLELDSQCMQSLRVFGDNTPTVTSVNFWNPKDEGFSKALALFGLKAPPVVVLLSGL